MAKTKAKKRTGKKSDTPAADGKAKSKDEMQKVRNNVTNVIVDGSLEMAARVIQSVTEGGQITALKYLWEVSGLFPSEAEADDGEPDSLAKILLDRMGIEGDIPGPGVNADGDVESEKGM
jgi:hypothetical protein